MASTLEYPSALKVRPLTGSIGAEVFGVDFSREIPDDVAEEIRQAFYHHFVLVFRGDRQPGQEEQNRLAALFGEPETIPLLAALGVEQTAITLQAGLKVAGSEDGLMLETAYTAYKAELQNIGIAGEFDGWHSDSTFTPWFHRVAVLRSPVIAPVGGDTSFASLCAAWDGLSPTVQRWLSDLRAVHMIPLGLKEGINVAGYGKEIEQRFDDAFPPREQPMVVLHPETGRKVLFLNPSDCVHIVGLKRAESHALLRFLAHHVASASFTYRHHWQPGDLVLWDELTVLHRAPDDYAPHAREVVRITAGRVVPTAAPADC